MLLTENKLVHSSLSFNYWATRTGLIPEESFLIDRYLSKNLSTVEAGTAGGRILFEMKARGFTSLSGFDHVSGLIETARTKDPVGEIKFSVQDAVSLSYPTESFEQVIYLQQIVCLIEQELARRKALEESYRILTPGGIALFSFLSFEARSANPFYFLYLGYLRAYRALHRSVVPIQYLPWMKLAGKFNWRCMTDAAPYVYWYRINEISKILENVGFRILAIGSSSQIENGVMFDSVDSLKSMRIGGMLYIVAQKSS